MMKFVGLVNEIVDSFMWNMEEMNLNMEFDRKKGQSSVKNVVTQGPLSNQSLRVKSFV